MKTAFILLIFFNRKRLTIKESLNHPWIKVRFCYVRFLRSCLQPFFTDITIYIKQIHGLKLALDVANDVVKGLF